MLTRNPSTPLRWWVAPCLLFALPPMANAESILRNHSGNGALLQVLSTFGFSGVDSAPSVDFGSAEGIGHADSSDGSVTPATLLAFLAPTSSTAIKDTAGGSITSNLSFGSYPTGPANDTFSFTFAGIVSALDAHNSAGSPADATFTGTAGADFYIDTFFAPAGSLVGDIDLPSVPALGPGDERIALIVSQIGLGGVSTIASLGPGDAAASVPLYAGNQYSVRFTYKTRAVFGVDPPFSLNYSTSIISAPEPSSFSLIFVAIGGLALYPRRRWQPPMQE